MEQSPPVSILISQIDIISKQWKAFLHFALSLMLALVVQRFIQLSILDTKVVERNGLYSAKNVGH